MSAGFQHNNHNKLATTGKQMRVRQNYPFTPKETAIRGTASTC